MIDIEPQVFTKVSNGLKGLFTGIFVTGEYVKSPPKFPAVSLVEMDNYTNNSHQTSVLSENFANLTYELNVYSNRVSGKKTECKKIMTAVDEIMRNIGFTRTFMSPVQNFEDASIYRVVARYTGTVGDDQIIYRR